MYSFTCHIMKDAKGTAIDFTIDLSEIEVQGTKRESLTFS